MRQTLSIEIQIQHRCVSTWEFRRNSIHSYSLLLHTQTQTNTNTGNWEIIRIIYITNTRKNNQTRRHKY